MSERIMTAIPFKVEKSETKRYFDRYFFHCIDCGNEYTSHHCTNRTSPYCVKCKKKHDREKAKELKDKREAEKIKAIRNMAIDEFAEALKHQSTFLKSIWNDTHGWVSEREIDEIAEQLKAENNDL